MTPSPLEPSTIRAIILGAGNDGTALLEVLTRSSRVKVVGIADSNPEAPGLRQAKRLGVPTATNALALIAEDRADLIIDVSGDPTIGPLIMQNKPPQAKFVGGTLARVVWEVAQYERDFRDRLIQAEKRAAIGTLASGIAHQINNPLYAITGLSELLRDETRPEVIKGYVEEIIQSGRRITTIVRDLNAFAQRSPQEDACAIDPNHMLDEAAKMVRRATVLGESKVVTQYGAVPTIWGNSEELLQVFVNLITNAVQAMEGRGTLTLSTTSADNFVLATVRDTGPGIPPNNIGQIFDPFFTTKGPAKGIGLGLYIANGIVTRYGGQVTVESALGQGTAFTVKLPVTSPKHPTAS